MTIEDGMMIGGVIGVVLALTKVAKTRVFRVLAGSKTHIFMSSIVLRFVTQGL